MPFTTHPPRACPRSRVLCGVLLLLCMAGYALRPGLAPGQSVSGELKRWHKVTVTFAGPAASEDADPNPFLDYRLNVTFSHAGSGTSYTVPGYYAADGNAAETSASAGNAWRVHFSPDQAGDWTYTASFRSGPDVAIDLSPTAGQPASFDGATGSFSIDPSDKTGRDHRANGWLRYVGARYLRYDKGAYFLKGGADSPENFLGYYEFDNTVDAQGPGGLQNGLHRYQPHVADWHPGDPTWQNGRGKGIIGALNYLAAEGMNSVYFLTMNVNGDGKEVYPWTTYNSDLTRYDVSKLDQWNIVFDHMDRLGLLLHVVTQETENDELLDGGALGRHRKLYYRELAARFGYHPALTWNLGEENTNTPAQRKEYATYLRAQDAQQHPIVVHTYADAERKSLVYPDLLGFPHFEGPSLQMSPMKTAHTETIDWIERSAGAGRPWVVTVDEVGPAGIGVTPDGPGNNHAEVRRYALWGNLMAGGAGVEWYFGYDNAHTDLNAEDWRSRDRFWDYTRFALDFFRTYLPFPQMSARDDLTPADDYVFALPGTAYAVYLPQGGTTNLTLAAGTYEVAWFDPRNGGALQAGSVATLAGPGTFSLGTPPNNAAQDWVALVQTDTGNDVPRYALTVNGGSGGGTYAEGASATVSANPPAEGQAFDRWTGDTQHLAVPTDATTRLTMPSGPVTITASYTASGAYGPGDISGNGKVSALDTALLLQHLVGSTQLSPEALAAGDVTGNGETTAFDGSIILQYVAGLISCFPVEEGCSVRF